MDYKVRKLSFATSIILFQNEIQENSSLGLGSYQTEEVLDGIIVNHKQSPASFYLLYLQADSRSKTDNQDD